MHIAIEGCLHGELEKVYDTIADIEQMEGIKISLLLSCGDFQSVRNLADLRCMAVPDKYKEMGTFWKYYSGQKKAPVLTIFIGGNHEASNFLQELPYGGWVAPNIYFLGYAGVVNVNGLRIGGMSGIFKGGDYLKGRYECPPYDRSTMRSVYHVRNLEVFRLKQLESNPPEIMMSHDWPRGIHDYGDTQRLLRRKQFFAEDIANNQLGSGPAMEVLQTLKPAYWFAGHLHVKFAALVHHEHTEQDKKDSEVEPPPPTKFLALDKCLPNRSFLQILTAGPEILEGEEVVLAHDPQWLAILKATNHLQSTSSKYNHMPFHSADYDGQKHVDEISQLDLTIHPDSFKVTADAFDPESPEGREPKIQRALNRVPDPGPESNPQTQFLCKVLEIDDPLVALGKGHQTPKATEKHRSQEEEEDSSKSSLSRLDLSSYLPTPSNQTADNEDEIKLSDVDDDDEDLGFEIDKKGVAGDEVEVEDEDLGFTIDTKGAAKRRSEECNDDAPKENDSSTKDPGVDEIKNDSDQSTPLVKKLKRRNVALYKSDDSE